MRNAETFRADDGKGSDIIEDQEFQPLTVEQRGSQNNHLRGSERSSMQIDRLNRAIQTNRKQSEFRMSTRNRQSVRNKLKSQASLSVPTRSKEVYVVTGDRITQEERIKNQEKVFKYPMLIIPSKSTFKTVWDTITGLLVLYTSFISPLDIAFSFSDSGLYTVYKTFDYIVLILFGVDILFNFRTTYYDTNLAEIVKPGLIAKNYLQNYNFYVDLISTIPISEIADITSGTSINSTYTRIFKQLKLFRILRLAKLTKFLQSENLKTIFQMFKMFFLFIVMFHWLTCLWFYIVKQDYDPSDPNNDYHVWIPTNLRELGPPVGSHMTVAQFYYDNMSDFYRYSYSLYSLVTLILGNDIGPVNTQQVIIGILLSIAGQFLMSLFFGEVSVLIVKLNQESTQYQSGLEAIEVKIKQNNFPDYIKVRIIEYFDYCWQKKISKDNQIDFSYFSRPLETQIHYFLKKEIIKGVPFFQELDSAEILWIIKNLRSEIYLPDDYIIRQGETGDSLYFMTEGVVKVIVKKSGSEEVLQQFNLKKGAFFGEVALLTQAKRTSDIVAIDFCVLESFTREAFQQLQVVFPDIHDRLQIGFSHYKIKAIDHISKNLQQNEYFADFERLDIEMDDIVREYMDLKFIEANRLILKPKRQSFCYFMIHQGQVAKLSESYNTQYVLRKLLIKKQSIDITKVQGKKHLKNNYFDYDMEDFPYDENGNNDCQILTEGQFIGELPFPELPRAVVDYYVTVTGCQLICLSQEKLMLMEKSHPEYYQKLQERHGQLIQSRTLQIENNDLVNNRRGKGNEFEQALDTFERMLKSQMVTLQNLNDKYNMK